MRIAKKAEIKNPQDYKTVVEVKDEGQTPVGSTWGIAEKEQNDGQKQMCKASLVTWGFQESDSTRALKESFKLLMAISANFGCKWASVDICAAILQSKV